MTTESIAERRVAHAARHVDVQLVRMAQKVNAPVSTFPWALAVGVVAVVLVAIPAPWRKRALSMAGSMLLHGMGLPRVGG